MGIMKDPAEITIIVNKALGIQGKKPGRHKFSVIFGLGGTKYRTAVVKDPNGSPEWNESSTILVSNILDQVFFIVTEKEDILGQITLAVTSLTDSRGRQKIIELQPHKKCPKPQGKLVFECFVSQFRADGDHTPIIKSAVQPPDEVRPRSAFERLRKRMASPVMQRRNKKEETKEHKSGLSSFNKKLSRSIQDLFSFSKYNGGEVDIDDNDSTTSSVKSVNKSKNKRKFSLSFLSMGTDLDKIGGEPKITSCSPDSGPVDQPTRLTIEGRNIAVAKSDILLLKVAGCDCTDTVEFESSSVIYCTTHYYKPCKGDIIIETSSNGICTLKNGYTFYEAVDANDNTRSLNPFEDDVEGAINDDESEKIEFSIGGHEIRSGSNTIPRIKNAALPASDPRSSPKTSTPVAPGRYRKNHARTASESVVTASSIVSMSPDKVAMVSKEELLAKIAKLEEDNAALKKDNVEMKSYIDKLVAKCMEHCPQALAQDDDEKSKLFLL